MKPRFTVVLTSYNRPKLVTDAIESVLEQTYKDWELLIADDDSNVETLKAIHKASRGDKRVKMLFKAGGSPTPQERATQTRYCVTINAALAIAKGEFITYCCDDDYFYPRRLELMVEAFDKNPNTHIVFGRLRSITYDANSLWDSSAAPKPGRSFPELGDIDPDTGKLVNPASWALSMTRTAGVLDHNMVGHRRVCLEEMGGPNFWPVVNAKADVGDRAFFERLDSLGHTALGIDAMVVTKKYHMYSMGRVDTSTVRE